MLKVSDLMTDTVFTLRLNDNLKTARQVMNLARIRHIPIVDDDNSFLGLVTHRDILAATVSQFAGIDQDTQDELDEGIPIQELMRTDVKAVEEDTTLREAAQILLNHKYGCLPVVRGGTLVGIITEADFLRLTISLMDALDKTM